MIIQLRNTLRYERRINDKFKWKWSIFIAEIIVRSKILLKWVSAHSKMSHRAVIQDRFYWNFLSFHIVCGKTSAIIQVKINGHFCARYQFCFDSICLSVWVPFISVSFTSILLNVNGRFHTNWVQNDTSK